MARRRKTLADVLTLCIVVDQKMQSAYRRFAMNASAPEDVEFWTHAVKEESSHVAFWRTAAGLRDLHPQMDIGDPEQAYRRIASIRQQLHKQITTLKMDLVQDETLLLKAYSWELLLFDSVFQTLFNTFSFVSPEVVAQYEEHATSFIRYLARRSHADEHVRLMLLEHILRQLFQLNRQLFLDSITDPLCAVLNRRGFFNQAIPRLHCNGKSSWNLLIIIDLDHFKTINDGHGHLVGDRILQQVAQALLHRLRPDDHVGRYGGDEFVVLCSLISPETAGAVLERLLAAIIAVGRANGLLITASLGAALGDRAASRELTEWIRLADTQLFRAKHAGRNCWRRGVMPPVDVTAEIPGA